MNKQQLASKIWESANQMRSKIEANEYKDYILGFIFYKYLSDKLVQKAIEEDLSEEDIQALSEEDEDTANHFKETIGYFMEYRHLFSTWITDRKNFDVSHVRDALSAFSRHISPRHKKLFDGVFNTLQTGLSKLGDSAASQTKAIRDLLHLIKDIPMDGRQGYDVLGFIYEYLIEKFAANAGKKAGEFYTPQEVSVLMSEIIAHHLKDKSEIQIYDSCSGSGSLLINIGASAAKYIQGENKIEYYAQELKQNTYNLTRMNLLMRGIGVDNIFTRNGDTLEDDWPFFDENDPNNTYHPLYVDAVVSNPPYSQTWDPEHKDNDARYSRFGLAPKGKADYAFLLHDLFHLKPTGIMAIVLPHGVLFRGNEEGTIRRKLIEYNHIDTIIGLPAGIFFGTGIPTIIMVLKQKRSNTDVLFIDASKGFVKDGKDNKLRASDIKRMVDAIKKRADLPKYAKLVSKEDIRANEYNLNIPRYVDASEEEETWDMYATMFGGIPTAEIDTLAHYWDALPHLRETLFRPNAAVNADLAVTDVYANIQAHPSTQAFSERFDTAFQNHKDYLSTQLLADITAIPLDRQESILSDDLFARLADIPLVDPYQAYQSLHDQWENIKIDVEIIHTEGFAATTVVDPHMVQKKKNGKTYEVQEGWKGRILPFELVQQSYLSGELNALQAKEKRLGDIAVRLEELIEKFSAEENDWDVLNESKDAFANQGLNAALKEILADVETEEIKCLREYLALLAGKAKKPQREAFIKSHTAVAWQEMEASKDGTYSKVHINKRIVALQSGYRFAEDSDEDSLLSASLLLDEEKTLKYELRQDANALHLQTKDTIEGLDDEQVMSLLEQKWVQPIVQMMEALPQQLLEELSTKVQALAEKYQTTYADVAQEISEAEQSLAGMIDQLTGSDTDMQALQAFKNSLHQKG